MEDAELMAEIRSAKTVANVNEIDTANWMGNLPDTLTSVPIHLLAIPGSHDSFSYTISRRAEIAPDDPELAFLNKIPCVRSVAKTIMYRWSVTQHLASTEQLEAGVRYFDLRIAPENDTHTLNLFHGLYGIQIEEGLMEILDFLLSHPREIVLLDFQHFYNFTIETHQRLMEKIRSVFGNFLCPVVENLNELTLKYLWKNNFQVFIFYRCGNSFICNDNCFWPSETIPNPWPNTVNPQYLIQYLQAHYTKGRPKNKFYVTQGVLTPSKSFVLLRFWSTLEAKLVSLVNQVLPGWLTNKNPSGINVVISDFVGSAACIAQDVIKLNFKQVTNDEE